MSTQLWKDFISKPHIVFLWNETSADQNVLWRRHWHRSWRDRRSCLHTWNNDQAHHQWRHDTLNKIPNILALNKFKSFALCEVNSFFPLSLLATALASRSHPRWGIPVVCAWCRCREAGWSLKWEGRSLAAPTAAWAEAGAGQEAGEGNRHTVREHERGTRQHTWCCRLVFYFKFISLISLKHWEQTCPPVTKELHPYTLAGLKQSSRNPGLHTAFNFDQYFKIMDTLPQNVELWTQTQVCQMYSLPMLAVLINKTCSFVSLGALRVIDTGSLAVSVTDMTAPVVGSSGGVYALVSAHLANVVMVRWIGVHVCMLLPKIISSSHHSTFSSEQRLFRDPTGAVLSTDSIHSSPSLLAGPNVSACLSDSL